MIVLDTNVISETSKPEPDAAVLAWLDGLDPSTTYLTAITAAELRHGVAILPEGRRKRALDAQIGHILEDLFDGRILPFDDTAAARYARLAARARDRGVTVSFADGMIGAIASVHRAVLATRDIAPFRAMEVETLNPWSA